MTLLAPRIGNDALQVRRINHESEFTWQAQYLMKLECDFSRSRSVNDVSYVMRIDEVGM